MKKLLLSLLFLLTLSAPSIWAETYTLVTDINELQEGDKIIIGAQKDSNWSFLSSGTTADTAKKYPVTDNSVSDPTGIRILTLQVSTNSNYPWLLYDEVQQKYIAPTKTNGASLGLVSSATNPTQAQLTTNSVIFNNTSYNTLALNGNYIRCYKSGNTYPKPQIFKLETSATPKGEHGLTWSAESYDYTMGEALDAPTLSNPNNLEVTYSSDNESVATIASDGILTIVGGGSATITATTVGDDTHKAGSVSYTLSVMDPNAPLSDIITSIKLGLSGNGYIDFDNKNIDSNAKYSGAAALNNGNIQLNTNKSSNAKNYRGIYTVESPGLLKSVNITFASSNTNTVKLLASNTPFDPTKDYSSATAIAELNKTTSKYNFAEDYKYFAITSKSGVIYISQIDVEWEKDERFVIPPVFSNEGGLVLAGTEVTLSAAEGLKVYFTTDGSDPTDQSTPYTEPIIVNDDMTLRAIAYGGSIASAVSEATFDVQKSLAEINVLEEGSKVLYSGALTVVFASGSNVYVYDGNDYTLLYQSGLGLAAGDVIKAGWSGTVSPYNGLFEIQKVTGVEKDADATPLAAVPVEVRRNDYDNIVNADNMNAYVEIKNIEITALSDKNFTSTFGTLYNQLNCNDYSAAGHYDVVGFVAYTTKTNEARVYPASMTLLEDPMIKVYWHNHNGTISIGWGAPHVHYSLDGETFEAVAMTVCASSPATFAADTEKEIPNDWEAEIPATATHLFFTNQGNADKKTGVQEAVDGKHYVASEDETTGIDSIAADNATPAEYYNLQGIRVAAPQKGNIYILRQGSKTSKIRY